MGLGAGDSDVDGVEENEGGNDEAQPKEGQQGLDETTRAGS